MNAMAKLAAAEMARAKALWGDGGWTDDVDRGPKAARGVTARKVRELWLAGQKCQEIADATGTSVSNVLHHVRKMGLPRKYGNPDARKYRHLENDVRRMWADGQTIPQISRDLGITISAAQHIKAYLGLPNRINRSRK